MEDFISDEDNGDDGDGIDIQEENPPSKSPSKLPIMKHEHFFEIIKLYPCLFNKSQSVGNKEIKQNALQEIKVKIENAYGLNLNGLQIRKKLENMKMRAKSKRDKIQMGDLGTKFKHFEEELLKLLDYKNNPLTKYITDPEQCAEVSADSSKYFKYEAEDEMSQDVQEEKSRLQPPPPSAVPSIVIPEIEIKSETNESIIHFDQVNDLNYKDTDSYFTSDDDDHHFDKIENKEKTTTIAKSGFGIKEKDFFDIIKCHGCLFEKSQAPRVKVIKQAALQAIKGHIKLNHGINLNNSQLRKKINNMKGRVKAKLYKSIKKNGPRYKLKMHERQLLNLMKLDKVSDPELCVDPNTSEDSNEAEEAKCSQEKEKIQKQSNNLPQCFNSTPKASENDQNNEFTVLSMQKEVLIEQKELNRQQNELNSLQKEVLILKKEKLMLEIDYLKKKSSL